MGRWPWSDRVMVENCLVLSVFDPETKRRVAKTGEDGFLEVVVSEDDVELFRHRLLITKTPTRSGGWRYWFRCHSCYKKVAKLYLPPQAQRFGCRKCHDLTYRSQKQHDKNVTALLKSPAMMHQLKARIEAGDLKACDLAFRASVKLASKR